MPNANERPRRKRLSWETRCEIVAKVRISGMGADAAAACSGVDRSTVYRLVARFDAGGWAGLRDRRPVPRRQPRRLSPEAEAEILALRQRTGYGPLRLGALLARPPSTVAKVLRRRGVARLERAARPVYPRYERARPGELLHVDTKRLGRFHTVGKRIRADGVQRSPRAGWHHLHVAVDDHSRLAYCEILAGQGAQAACAFLARAVAWFAAQGIGIERVLSDNGHAYRSHAWRDLCAALGIARRYTRPYTPRTNGKACVSGCGAPSDGAARLSRTLVA
jgi:transposase InsO family protein